MDKTELVAPLKMDKLCLIVKKIGILHRFPMQNEKSQPEGKRIMSETRFTEKKVIDRQV